MAERPHRSKYQIQLTIGLLLLLGFTLLTYSCIFEKQLNEQKYGPWYMMAGIAGLLLCLAAYFLSSATIHKVKSDISRKSRKKETQDLIS